MANFTSGNVAILKINGADVSEYFEQATLTRKRNATKLPRIGSNGTAQVVGAREVTIKADYWHDPSIIAILTPLIDADPAPTATIVYEPEGAGGQTRTITVFCSDLDEKSDAKDANKGTVTFESTDGVIS